MSRLAEQVPELRFIDVDLEQLRLEQPPVDFPCALIDVSRIEYSSNGQRQQQAEVDMSVTLGFKVLTPESFHVEKECKAQAMQHYAIIDKVAQALHGFAGATFARLDRVSITRNANTYPRHYTLHFRTQYTEEFD